jgi:hypothetical protein
MILLATDPSSLKASVFTLTSFAGQVAAASPHGLTLTFLLTADARGLPQTFLPADPAGKKHVNRFAIIFLSIF